MNSDRKDLKKKKPTIRQFDTQTILNENQQILDNNSQPDNDKSKELEIIIIKPKITQELVNRLKKENRALQNSLDISNKEKEQLAIERQNAIAEKNKVLREKELANQEMNLLKNSIKNSNQKYTKLENETNQIKQENTMFAKELASMKPLIQTNIRLQEEVNLVSSQHTSLSQKLHTVNEANIEYRELVSKVLHENMKIKNELTLAQKTISALTEERRQDKDKILIVENKLATTNIHLVKNDFAKFVKSYLAKNTKKSSGCFGFFSFHGSDGRDAANNINHAFNLNIENVHSKEELLNYLKTLKINNEQYITGNYYAASFKTYLLAYYNYVSELNLSDIYLGVDVSDYVKNYARNTRDIKKQYEQIFSGNDISMLVMCGRDI